MLEQQQSSAMTALIDKYLNDVDALDPVRKALARNSMILGDSTARRDCSGLVCCPNKTCKHRS